MTGWEEEAKRWSRLDDQEVLERRNGTIRDCPKCGDLFELVSESSEEFWLCHDCDYTEEK